MNKLTHLGAWNVVAVLILVLGTGKVRAADITFNTRPTSGADIPATVYVGQSYIYDIDAVASNGSTIHYSLTYGPAGMTVDEQTGVVEWQAMTAGTYAVGIRAELADDPTQTNTQEWMLVAGSVSDPAISTNPLSFASVCRGGTISVDYTASGDFVPGNAFILQLSDANGGFTKFQNIGSISSTTSGTITTSLPKNVAAGSHYRVRVISSNPPLAGSDNGSDFSIAAIPTAEFKTLDAARGQEIWDVTITGAPLIFTASSEDDLTYHWDFGPGATPETYEGPGPVTVIYSVAGEPTVTLTGISAAGCTTHVTREMYILPSNPQIPVKTAVVPGSDSIIYSSSHRDDRNFWVCPGGIFYNGSDYYAHRLYAESGSSITLKNSSIHLMYLKSGSSLNVIHGSGGVRIIVHEPGVSIDLGPFNPSVEWVVIPVDSIQFDYTDAPVGGCPSLATYTKRINDATGRITGTEVTGDSDKEFWIGGHGVLEASGRRNTYIADPGARITATGDSCIVYLKNGSSFEARGSRGHRIFHELNATIVNAGDGSRLFPSSALTYIHHGSEVSGVNNQMRVIMDDGVIISPNPAVSAAAIYNNTRGTVRGITVHTALGEMVRQQNVMLHDGESLQFPVEGIAAGIYYLRMIGDNGTFVKKLIVR